MLRRTAALPETVCCSTICIWWQSGDLLFGHFKSKDDSSITRDCFNGPRDCLVEYGSKNGSSPRDCVGRQRMNKVTVLGTACCILINFGNGPWDCCLVNMLRRTAAVAESVWCTTIWIWWQSGGLLFGHFDSKDDSSITRDYFNGLRDCLVGMVRRRAAVSGTVLCTTIWISLQSWGLYVAFSWTLVTVPGTFVWSKWFEELQQSQRLSLYVVQLHEYGHSLKACCLVTVLQRTKAVPGTVLCTTVWIWLQSWGMLFGHYGSKDDSSPRDCVVHHRMGMATVLGNVVWSR